jgi:hypothetical protein
MYKGTTAHGNFAEGPALAVRQELTWGLVSCVPSGGLVASQPEDWGQRSVTAVTPVVPLGKAALDFSRISEERGKPQIRLDHCRVLI